ncbi:hypothetical protein [Paludisphaera borealis]|uniref:Uncharacterized protein n=1 Tax=Paludisphaera borealis TaxID=1387353 RepID=A0A1U7CJP2_9BACT|nr:hypothetical protein [Paludisphaera borealis]APW59126.1 hypothetical protein BSF38_00540 [Paludisphaera borealis]
MTSSSSILADFAVRLAFGLSLVLAATSWRMTPLAFFRTNSQVILGLLVLAALDVSRGGATSPACWSLAAAAFAAYAATIAWGLGLARIGRPVLGLIAVVAAAWLTAASYDADRGLWMFNSVSRGASGFVLGATLAAMLLGHHYLTAPSMSIEPLKRYVRFMGWALAVRGALGLSGLLLSHGAHPALGVGAVSADSWIFPMMRWGMGFVAPAVATALAWKTVQIRSTQSATGILYAAMTLLLFGELSSLIAARGGVPIV